MLQSCVYTASTKGLSVSKVMYNELVSKVLTYYKICYITSVSKETVVRINTNMI